MAQPGERAAVVDVIGGDAQDAVAEAGQGVVLLAVAGEADAGGVPAFSPDTAFDLQHDLLGWPAEVRAKATAGDWQVLADGLRDGQVEADLQGHDGLKRKCVAPAHFLGTVTA